MSERKKYKINCYFLNDGLSLKSLLEDMFLIYVKNLRINN
jgi:hypothetical protein